jgi:catechol 2,3-dioxygenase-like lactoylglutathione lyase family enzyme
MSNVELDHVQIAAPRGCEDQARRFFGDLFGLSEVQKPESLAERGGVWFSVGGHELHVGVEEGFKPARKAHPALRLSREEDLEALAKRLEAAGRTVHWDENLPGVRRFYSEDPWGNRIELRAA